MPANPKLEQESDVEPIEKLVAWWHGQETDAVRRGEVIPDRNVVLYHWSGIQITAKEMRDLINQIAPVKQQ